MPTGIVVKSQATRSRSQNRKIARELLAARLDELRNGEQSRTAVVTRLQSKRKASASKKSRRKYRELAEAEEAEADREVEALDTREPSVKIPKEPVTDTPKEQS